MVWLLLLLLSICCIIVLSSNGDNHPYYQHCRSDCYISCNNNSSIDYSVPLYGIVPLSCEELCSYKCIEDLSRKVQEHNLPTMKFYGHWPFIRYFGLEEPASSVFSALNILPHLLNIISIIVNYNDHSKSGSYMSGWLLLYSLLGVNCWISSTIYHAKKTPITTNYDLISALLIIAMECFLVLRRIISSRCNNNIIMLSFMAMSVLIIIRICYMIAGLISFTNHMVVCIVIVIVTLMLWIIWVLFLCEYKDNNRWLCLVCQLSMIFASSFEVFDFPPLYGIFDAHSVWHFLTIPIGFLWYRFWSKDNYYLTNNSSIEHLKSD